MVGCFQVVIYFWCWNAKIFCFVLSDEGPKLCWICRQTFSNDVVNVTVIGFSTSLVASFLNFEVFPVFVFFLFSWL